MTANELIAYLWHPELGIPDHLVDVVQVGVSFDGEAEPNIIGYVTGLRVGTDPATVQLMIGPLNR